MRRVAFVLALVGFLVGAAGSLAGSPAVADPQDYTGSIIAAWHSAALYVQPSAQLSVAGGAVDSALGGTADPVLGTVRVTVVLPNHTDTDALQAAEGSQNTIVVIEGFNVEVYPSVAFNRAHQNSYFSFSRWAQARYAQSLLEYRDATPALLGLVRALHGNLPADSPAPATGPADAAQVSMLAGALRANPVYVAPDARFNAATLTGATASLNRFPHRIAVLPALPPGTPEPQLADALAGQFPGDLVVVDRGGWLSAAGPYPVAQLVSAREYALVAASSLDDEVTTFVDRLAVLRGATPTAHAAAEVEPEVGDTVHAWAPWLFLGTALLMALTVFGLTARRRLAAHREQARTAQLERAEATALLARLAHELLTAEADPLRRDQLGRHLGEAGERYATATGLLDSATSAAEFDAASAAAAAGLALLGVRSAGARQSATPVTRHRRTVRDVLAHHPGVGRALRVGRVLLIVAFVLELPALFISGYMWVHELNRPVPAAAAQAFGPLADNPVYVQPGAGQWLDAARAKSAIADRPILVVAFDHQLGGATGSDALSVCSAIASHFGQVMVVLLQPKQQEWNCVSEDWPGSRTDGSFFGALNWGSDVAQGADWTSWRETASTGNQLPFVHQLATEYDLAAPQLSSVPPPRTLGDPLALVKIIGWLAVAVLAALGLFLGVTAYGRRRARARGDADRIAGLRAEVQTKVYELAARIGPDGSAQQAEGLAKASQRYLLALRQLDRARTEDELREVSRLVDQAAELAG